MPDLGSAKTVIRDSIWPVSELALKIWGSRDGYSPLEERGSGFDGGSASLGKDLLRFFIAPKVFSMGLKSGE